MKADRLEEARQMNTTAVIKQALHLNYLEIQTTGGSPENKYSFV